MKIVIQRVSEASVEVDGKICGEIGKGYLVLLGVGDGDTEAGCIRLADKLINLRIFSDENDKINLSLKDVNGQLLIVSQFTLYADCRKGNRPNFTQVAKPDTAKALYEFFIEYCKKSVPVVQSGIFGADMKVRLLNDGPFTVVIE